MEKLKRKPIGESLESLAADARPINYNRAYRIREIIQELEAGCHMRRLLSGNGYPIDEIIIAIKRMARGQKAIDRRNDLWRAQQLKKNQNAPLRRSRR